MKCQNLFSGKNKKNIISLSSAEFAHCVVMVKQFDFRTCLDTLLHQILENQDVELFCPVPNISPKSFVRDCVLE